MIWAHMGGQGLTVLGTGGVGEGIVNGHLTVPMEFMVCLNEASTKKSQL